MWDVLKIKSGHLSTKRSAFFIREVDMQMNGNQCESSKTYIYTYIYWISVYLEPKWPLFWTEWKGLFLEGSNPKVEDKQVPRSHISFWSALVFMLSETLPVILSEQSCWIFDGWNIHWKTRNFMPSSLDGDFMVMNPKIKNVYTRFFRLTLWVVLSML